MNIIERYKKQSDDNFVRTVGLSGDKFCSLVALVRAKIEEQKQKHPLTKRGLKSKISIEEQE